MLSDLPIPTTLAEQTFSCGLNDALGFHARSIPFLWKSRNREYGQRPSYSPGMDRNATSVLSRKVRNLMARRGWTLVELSKRSGVSKSAIGNLLNYRDHNDAHPSTRSVELLGAAFGFSAWQMLAPDDAAMSGIAEPEPLDVELLATVLTEAADLFRARNALPSFELLANAAARMYDLVTTGIPMRRAADTVSRHLQQIGSGTILAGSEKSSGEGLMRGQGKAGAHRRGKTRTR